MKYNDIEKELSSFTLKGPNRDLKGMVLLKARTVWAKEQHAPVSPSKLIRNYAYALATLLLISITSSKIDSFLTDKLLDGKTILAAKSAEKNNNLEKLCSDLGVDCRTYKLLANMDKIEEDENESNIFNQRDKLMKEFNLINGGLS